RVRKDRAQLGGRTLHAVVHPAHQAGGRADVAFEDPARERDLAHAVPPSSRTITTSDSSTPTRSARSFRGPGKSSNSKRSAHSLPAEPAKSPRKVRPETLAAANR